MLEKHSQTVGAPGQSVVEPQYAVTHERKGSRRDQRLRKAPPWHDGIGTIIPDDTFSRGNCDRDIHAQVISLFPRPSKQVPHRRRYHDHPAGDDSDVDGVAAGRSSMKLLPLQGRTRFSLPTKNIENNPMQSSRPVAGMCGASDTI
jgi:hypothetical protein